MPSPKLWYKASLHFFPNHIFIWAAPSEFGTYRLCEQRRFRRACASALSRQNLRTRSYKQRVKRNRQTENRSLAPLNGWPCAVKICHDGMLEDTNSLDGAHLIDTNVQICLYFFPLDWLNYFPVNQPIKNVGLIADYKRWLVTLLYFLFFTFISRVIRWGRTGLEKCRSQTWSSNLANCCK